MSKRHGIRRLVRPLVLLVLVIALVAVGYSRVLRYGLALWLREQGADNVAVQSLRVNPFNGVISLGGIRLSYEGKMAGSDGRIVLDLGLRSLLRKQVVVQSLEFDGIMLTVNVAENGDIQVGGLNFSPDKGRRKRREMPAFLRDITVEVGRVRLGNCRVAYSSPRFSGLARIEQAEARNLVSVAGNLGAMRMQALTLKGYWNSTGIDIALHDLALGPGMALEGRVNLKDVDLSSFAPLAAPALDQLHGMAAVTGKVDLDLHGDGSFRVSYQGILDLEQAVVGGPGWGSIRGSAASWDGSAGLVLGDALDIRAQGRVGGTGLFLDLPHVPMTIEQPELSVSAEARVAIGPGVEVDCEGSLAGKGTVLDMPALLRTAGASLDFQGKVHYDNLKRQSVQVSGRLDATGLAYRHGGSGDGTPSLLDTGLENLAWQGELDFQGRSAQGPGKVDHQGRAEVTGYRLNLGRQGTSLRLGGMVTDGTARVSLGAALGTRYDGAFRLSGTELALDSFRTAGGVLDWNGKVAWSQSGASGTELEIDGRLEGAEIDVELARPDFHVKQKKATLQVGKGRLSLPPEGAPELRGRLEIDAAGLNVEDGFREHVADLASCVITSLELRETGDLEIRGLRLGPGRLSLRDDQARGIALDGASLEEMRRAPGGAVQVKGLEVSGARVVSHGRNQVLLSAKRLEAGSASMQDTVVRARGLVAREVDLLAPAGGTREDSAVRVDALQVPVLDYDPQAGIGLDEVALRGLVMEMELGSQGFSLKGAGSDSMKRQPREDREDKQENAGVPPLRITLLHLGGDGRISFRDTRLSPPYHLDMRIKEARVEGLDTGGGAPFSFSLSSTIDTYASLDARGTATLPPPSLELDLTAELRNYDLRRISRYAVAAVGYRLTGGLLNISNTTAIHGGMLSTTNKVVLKKLDVEEVSGGADAENKVGSTGMPLGTALSMLSDRQDNIELDLPLGGPLDDLNIGVGGIIGAILTKAAMAGAEGYLIYALGPYGLALKAAEMVGSEMMRVRLPPVEFEPGVVEVGKGHKDYLDRLAKVLAEKKKISVSLCPRPVPADLPEGSEEELEALGMRRAENLRAVLVRDYGIDPGRIVLCDAQVDREEGARPRVGLKF